MPKLRKGDVVAFNALVTAVADYDEGQQIMAKLLPSGKEIGWCVPKEYSFVPVTFVIKVGDMVTVAGESVQDTYEVMAVFENNQVAIKKTGCWPIKIAQLCHLKRI